MQSEALYSSHQVEGHWYPRESVVHVSVKGDLSEQVATDLMKLCAYVIAREKTPGVEGVIIDFRALRGFDHAGIGVLLSECHFLSENNQLAEFPVVLLVRSSEQGWELSSALSDILLKPKKTLRYNLYDAVDFIQSCHSVVSSEG